MKPLWRQFKSNLLICVFALSAISIFSGCYEGWKKLPSHDGNGDGSGKAGGGAITKPIGLLIVDVIGASEEAMTSTGCANVPSSLVNLRKWEIEQRLKSIQAVLVPMADSVRTVPILVPPKDCANQVSIRDRAEKALENLDLSSKELKAKPAVHLRVVFWFDDATRTYPPASVLNSEWMDGRRLKKSGFTKVLNATYFTISGPSGLYFNTWSGQTDPQLRAIVIAQPTADDAGVQAVTNSVSTSQQEFVTWFNEKLSRL